MKPMEVDLEPPSHQALETLVIEGVLQTLTPEKVGLWLFWVRLWLFWVRLWLFWFDEKTSIELYDPI